MPYNICLYFRQEPEKNRFFWGDKYLRKFYKFLFRNKKISGIHRVFLNLCRSFDELNIDYTINKPFNKLKENDIPIVIGVGKYSLQGYNKSNPIIAGIALMTHPSEWPNLCQEYPIAKYLQHSKWANDVYVNYYGNEICDTWFSGIDTEKWKQRSIKKTTNILIYNKIRWNQSKYEAELTSKIKAKLSSKGFTFKEIIYGKYKEGEYLSLLNDSEAVIYLCEHESQGFASGEALSMNIPILAWDQGLCLDPNRFNWNDPVIPASSVPFFNDECGMKFKDYNDFNNIFPTFIEKLNANKFSPRKFVTNNLSLEKSGARMIEIIKQVYPNYE